jgi:glutamate-1-semialdehyde 2,1-aminomutase
MKDAKSRRLYRDALRVMPGGVSSPVRAFRSVLGTPLFIRKGSGSKIWDVDGNSFIDYVLSWGPMILGHAHPEVTEAVTSAVESGTSFGAPTYQELELAKRVCSSLPSVQMVRFVNSGTEATMSAVRLARGFTGRKKILKFEGCYHGHADPFLARAGSGLAALGISDSPGVPDEVASNTITVGFNDLHAAEEVFRREGPRLAAVIVEPIAGNMGVVPPERGFLRGLKLLCKDSGALLIFDEVITGFRVARDGAQGLYGVSPDLTCLGKVIGGGFPVGAYGGSREVMRLVAPGGPVYQAGTLSGNPVAMAAGLATLKLLDRSAYARLERTSGELRKILLEASGAASVPVTINRVGSMLGLFFGDGPVTNFEQAKNSDHSRYPKFHRVMLESGCYMAPSAFETTFLSTAHSDHDLEMTLRAAKRAFKQSRS